MISRFGREFWTTALLVLCAALSGFAQQSSAQNPAAGTTNDASKSFRVAKIEANGLKRVSLADLVRASGLQEGQTVDLDAVDAAAQRVVDSGLFKKVGYRLRTKNGDATITFDVVESAGAMPVVFDNFVWFKDEELRQAIKEALPTFDGTLPESSAAIETARGALEKLLKARGVAGAQVETAVSTGLNGANPQRLFAVTGVRIPICKINFAGGAGVSQEELQRTARPLTEESYSRQLVQGFAEASLLPLYFNRGRLRASVGAPSAQLAPSSERCENGVSVTIPIDEGSIYVWSGVEWTGNKELSAAQLNAVLGMKPNEVADASKIQKGFTAAQKLYGRKGFLDASVKAAPVFDDLARRVFFRVEVKEGAQYRMGSLVVNGLESDEEERVRAKWELSPGALFNQDYVRDFSNKVLNEVKFNDPKARRAINVKEAPDREHQIVDVTLTFK